MTIFFASIFGLFLAYANGANDNFKGVATLYGSRTATYKAALTWATIATFAGSVAAVFLAQGLVATFSGRGLIPDETLALKSFALAVMVGSALTVMLATKLGFPVSTTHALTGALVGAGWLASNGQVNIEKLGASFFGPLLASPVLAIFATLVIYPLFRMAKKKIGVNREMCVCVGTQVVAQYPQGTSPTIAIAQFQSSAPSVSVGTMPTCRERYSGQIIGMEVGKTVDYLHFLSAGVVSFARGLNDTPKIAALLLTGAVLPPTLIFIAVALVMAVGGWLNARKVAETMANGVTVMNPGQGLVANLITGLIVIFASKFGVPVSTTHVSCGAIFGIGVVTKQGNWRTIASILVAWITTLPIAAVISVGSFLILRELLPS